MGCAWGLGPGLGCPESLGPAVCSFLNYLCACTYPKVALTDL